MTDRNEAMRLADAARIAELEQALDRLQGNYLIAFERGRIAGIAEFESRVHTCGPTCSKAGCINRRVTAERDQLRAEVERLRPNAMRYEFLRDDINSDWAICEWSHDEPDGIGYYRDARAPDVVDAAIDLARTHKETP